MKKKVTLNVGSGEPKAKAKQIMLNMCNKGKNLEIIIIRFNFR